VIDQAPLSKSKEELRAYVLDALNRAALGASLTGPLPPPKTLPGKDGGHFVYVISNPAWPGYCKVGCTHHLRARFNSYNTSDPNRAFKLDAYFTVVDKLVGEDEAHKALDKFRVVGTEWFNIAAEDAAALLTEKITMKDTAA
jgi:hypothetical protein